MKFDAAPRKTLSAKRRMFAAIKYSSTVPVRVIRNCFKRQAHIINNVFKNDVETGIAFSMQKSAFRRHFADNWLWDGQVAHTHSPM